MVRYLVALLPLFLLLCVAFPAQSEEQAEAPQAVKDYVIVKLDGEDIHYSEIQKIWEGLFPGEGEVPSLASFGDQVRNNIVRGIVTERILTKEAYKKGLDKSPEILSQLENLKQKLMVKELLEKRTADISEDAIKQKYEETIAGMEGKEEIHASHILVEDEAKAIELAAKLDNGAEFEKLAEENSTDKGTAVRGGDLGFFTQDQMVPEFAEEAFKLKAGEISKPVKSSFGWHVIKVHERRQVPLPTLEESRAQITKLIAREKNKEYLLDLLGQAEVTYLDPEGNELKLSLDEAVEESAE